jgi:hypothetical protein
MVYKTKTLQNTTLQKKELLVLFAIKILAGFSVGLVNIYLYNNGTDYDSYNNLGKIETDNLIHHSNIFLTDIYKPYLDKFGSQFFIDKHFIGDLGPNIILKILALLNLVTKGNYYSNNIFFLSVSFVGCVALYNTFAHVYKSNKTALIIGCFLLPSTLFFTSGIHKDLVIFYCLCFFCNALYFSFENGFSTKRIIVLVCTFVLLGMIRLHVGAVLLPIAAIYFICKKYTVHFVKVSTIFFAIFIIATLIVQKIKPSISLIDIISKKQIEFVQLGVAKTDYKYSIINSSAKNMVMATPSAVRNAFLSPIPFEFPYWPINLFGVEICIYALLFLISFWVRKKQAPSTNMFVQFVILFALAMMLIIGYSITNAGSLIRYRSIYLPFIVIPILCGIDWERLNRKFIS